MRYYIHLCLILFPLIFFSCAERHKTTIKGTLYNGKNEMVWLERLNISKTVPVDSQKINNKNNFNFKLKIEYPDLYFIKNKDGKIFNLIIHPGDNIDLSGDYHSPDKNYTIKGSPDSEKVKILVDKLEETKANLKELENIFSEFSSLTDEQSQEYLNKTKAIIKDQRDFSIRFILNNIHSLSSIYALYQTYAPNQLVLGANRDLQYMKIVADTLSLIYPDVPLVTSFVKDARDSESKYYNFLSISELMSKAETGLPDISIMGQNGKNISLSSLKGKTVLLYFWASSSVPSREQNPSLLNIYKKYKNKGFEIYAVSLDSDKESWEKAIWVDELDWINVCELSYPDSKAALTYNVRKLPTNFLINSSGAVIARDLYGRELEKWLDNIL